MAGHGGGAWKVAYADFVTAMMAFFMVMWIVAQNKPVKEAVALYFTDPYGTSNKPGRSKAPIPLAASGSMSITPAMPMKVKTAAGKAAADPGAKPAEDADHRSRSPGKAGMPSVSDDTRTVGSLIRFDDQDADLDETARLSLDELLPELLGKSFRIEIRGHTSGKPLPSGSPFPDPWALSYARAQAVMRYLIEHGVSPKRIRLSQAAANEQNAHGENDGLRKQSARVEIYALNELVYDPSAISNPADAKAAKPDPRKRPAPKPVKQAE
jgi:chemotaxis protein MotB